MALQRTMTKTQRTSYIRLKRACDSLTRCLYYYTNQFSNVELNPILPIKQYNISIPVNKVIGLSARYSKLLLSL